MNHTQTPPIRRITLAEYLTKQTGISTTEPDYLYLVTALSLIILASEMSNFMILRPREINIFLKYNNLQGLENRERHKNEKELYIIVAHVKDEETSEPYFIYEASIILSKSANTPTIIVRGMPDMYELQNFYHALRYGSLLDSNTMLPPEHLVNFESIPNLGPPTQLVLSV